MEGAFPSISSVLSPDHLRREVANHYSIEIPLDCKFFLCGASHTYQIATAKRHYYLRVYRAESRTRQEVKSELQILLFLDRVGIPVATPVERTDRSLVGHLPAPEGVRFAVLFREAPGKPLDVRSKQDCQAYGRLVARMHTAFDRTKHQYTRPYYGLESLVDRPIELLKPHLVSHPDKYDFLISLGKHLKARLRNLPRTQPEFGLCHGDLNSCNIHVDAGKNFTFLDFDLCGYGWRVRDLVAFLYEDCYADPLAWESFLDGYNEQRPLSQSELASIPAFLAVYHIEVLRFTVEVSRQVAGESAVSGILNTVIDCLETALLRDDQEIGMDYSWRQRWGAPPSPTPAQSLLAKQ